MGSFLGALLATQGFAADKLTPDNIKTYCIYDGPNENAIRKAAERNGLPVQSITEVSVLDPYFYA